jgi:hypothetical protein
MDCRVKPLPGEWPVLDLVTPIPLDVACDVLRVVGRGLERRGYAVFFREADGLTRIWVRYPAREDE